MTSVPKGSKDFSKGDFVRFVHDKPKGIFRVVTVTRKLLPPMHYSDYDWDEVRLEGHDKWYFANALVFATPLEIAKWKIENESS